MTDEMAIGMANYLAASFPGLVIDATPIAAGCYGGVHINIRDRACYGGRSQLVNSSESHMTRLYTAKECIDYICKLRDCQKRAVRRLKWVS